MNSPKIQQLQRVMREIQSRPNSSMTLEEMQAQIKRSLAGMTKSVSNGEYCDGSKVD